KPSSSYMTLNPFIISDTKIIKKESEELTITCAIRCVPVCDVRWSVKAFNAL
ncbi:inner ear-specific collagen, partial [Biomphalaria glabrata]